MSDRPRGRLLGRDVRSDLRHFAFVVCNRTLYAGYTDIDIDDLDYSGLLLRRDDTVGQLFAIYLNVLSTDREGNMPSSAGSKAKYPASQWLRHACDPGYEIVPPLEPGEMSLDTADFERKQAIKDFARLFGRGTLAPEVLQSIDYIETFGGEGGSYLEMIFAIFSNVLRIDDEGRPLNALWATRRAAMYVRSYEGTGYQPEPKFAAWEVELL